MEEITGQLMWSTASKVSLYPKKVMLCIWWVWNGVLDFTCSFQKIKQGIPRSTAPNLDQRKAILNEKCPELVNRKCISFLQDNTRPHVYLVTVQSQVELGWEVLTHRPYSSDCTPLDFNLFWSLQISFNGENLNSLEDCKRHLEQFFAQKDKKFWEDGIMKLLGKWQKFVK